MNTTIKKLSLTISACLATFSFGSLASNTNYGISAGQSIISGGTYNSLFGLSAGNAITDGDHNTFFGAEAGLLNTANGNVFLGSQSGKANTTGDDNVFIGYKSGFDNTTGKDNVFIGDLSANKNTTGRDNVFIGTNSAYYNTTGSNNIAVGKFSFLTNTVGSYNVALGDSAGYDNSTGGANVYVGQSAGIDNGAGIANTFIGAYSANRNEHADFNTFIGAASGFRNNTSNGTTQSIRNTAIGTLAQYSNEEGSDNVSVGAFSGSGDSTGSDFNDLLDSFSNPSSEDFPTFYGLATTGYDDGVNRATRLGTFASSNKDDTISVGYDARTIGLSSITVGSKATTNHHNAITLGFESISHADNTAVIGNNSTLSIDPHTDGSTSLGSSLYRFNNLFAMSGYVIADTDTSATFNLWADAGSENNDKWSIVVADSGDMSLSSMSSGSLSDVITLNNSGDVTVAGDLVVNSDARLKRDTHTITNALTLIEQLEGKTYFWKDSLQRDNRKKYGFIAQEVEQVIPELITNNDEGIKSVNYQGVIPVLVNAVHELKQEATARKDEAALLKEQIALLSRQVELQQKILDQLTQGE